MEVLSDSKVVLNELYWWYLCEEITEFNVKLEYAHRMTADDFMPDESLSPEKQIEKYKYTIRRIRETVGYALANSIERKKKLNKKRNE